MPTNLPKKHFTYTISDFYKEYKKESDNPIPYKLYKDIIVDFFVEIMKKIIYENHVFQLPHGLGSILVKARKTNLQNARVDFHLTKKFNKTIRHLNQNTFGYYFHIWWEKKHKSFNNHQFYQFKPAESKCATDRGVGKKALSNHIKETAKDPLKKSYIKI